jgi:uncharacterized NAD(P)/FAD-binding protein YdhS
MSEFADRGARRVRCTASPSEPGCPAVAIIGAGFTGSLLALHLLRRCPRTRVILIERNRQFGRGLAYEPGNDNHLLNVPAGRMSAFHDRPDDFVQWLHREDRRDASGARYNASSFVPRRLFGTYVRHLLNGELKGDDARATRHLRPWWDVHRHRMPPEIADRIDRLMRLGRLTGHGRSHHRL